MSGVCTGLNSTHSSVEGSDHTTWLVVPKLASRPLSRCPVPVPAENAEKGGAEGFVALTRSARIRIAIGALLLFTGVSSSVAFSMSVPRGTFTSRKRNATICRPAGAPFAT